ncbi:MAG: bifunctional hydroxymethylpyrimidine kinase/phosphomethylpyrimidine kinase [Nitrospirae bacterium]|nr:bifunctional hydroxymethylpyrimidine kinase/phosphomethylpyrimidine kinase [Nitrospirota bacterium]MBF0533438.1 bifunctional hydroxymethylpyrimidine kinase/phosphomethylpyrimidine kinase [Nitrospirota bacterium]MBF0616038.1 bifunctional hydroxymethylpyrimidine kinase/phosphomethylpyrimidine kinase [Nitrospirota bacterium]
MTTALTVAGFDPTGGAGLQADLKAFHAHGVYGLSVASSITAQNTQGVSDVYAVSPEIFERQLSVLLSDLTPDAVKTGILPTADIVEILDHYIRKYNLKNLVIDPVTVSTSGKTMTEAGVPEAVKQKLLPLCECFTPNISEAALYSGMDIKTEADIDVAARLLREFGVRNVIITGGQGLKSATDTFYGGAEFIRMETPLKPGTYHGTGCLYSAAVSANLAKGIAALESARLAKAFVTNAIDTRAIYPGGGMAILNV